MKLTTFGKCYQRLAVRFSLAYIPSYTCPDDQQEQRLSKSIINRPASGIEVPEGLASQPWINYSKYAVNAYANRWALHSGVAASKLAQHFNPNTVASCFTLIQRKG